MRKTTFIIILFLISSFVYAREVPATNQGIANASPGDYIIRSSGERVILKQSDIDYARRQSGLTTTQNTQSRATSSSTNSNQSHNNSDGLFVFVFLLILAGIIIVIGICISNVTTTVAKSAGMDEESAKKVGKSAGVLAGTAAAIGAAILLGKAGEIKKDPNNITITHKY